MAAGLGTRMRSDVPKHLHPILGRRMVDWVLESSRALGVDPLVVVAAPATAAAFDGLDSRRPGRAARNGRRRSLRSRVARRRGRRRARPLRRHAAPDVARPPRARRDASPRGRRGDRALVRARRPEAVRACPARRRTADSPRSSSIETRRTSSARVREVNSSIYVFRADRLWPVLDRLTPHNAQGELYLTDSVAHPRRGRRPRRSAQGRRSGGDGGCEHASRAGCSRGGAPRPDQRGAHARGRDDRRSREHVDRRRRGARARRGRSIRSP